MMNSRVLILSHEFPPYLGGVGTVAAQLARFLTDQGIDVHVMTRYQKERIDIPGVTVHDVDVMPKLWFHSYHRALGKLGLAQFDRIILNEAAPAVAAGKYFDVTTLDRCILLLHGLEVERLYRPSFSNLGRRLFGFAAAHRRAVSLSRHVLAVSEDMREKFIAAAGNVSRAPIDIIRAGVDTRIFRRIASDYRTARNIPSGRTLLVTGSRIEAAKGFGEMLDAFGTIAISQDIAWVICGDGPMLPALRRRVTAAGLDNKVLFEGSCSREQLCWIYNDCDLFWLVSNYREAFPLVYAEAQLSGLPTIGRNFGGVAEAISPGKTGWLVENASQAIAVVREFKRPDDSERDTIAAFAQRFSMERTLTALLPLMRENT